MAELMSDYRRLAAIFAHDAVTLDQAAEEPLVKADLMQQCARPGCGNWIETGTKRKYCTDPECQWKVGVERARAKNARRKIHHLNHAS